MRTPLFIVLLSSVAWVAVGQAQPTRLTPRESTDLSPLVDMSANDRYYAEDGGLYGQGRNTPPEEHYKAAEAELRKVEPLDAEGVPSKSGKIAFISISMSNATQEFSVFKRLADADPAKSPLLTIVDCAQGGQAMAEWANPEGRPWSEADRRLAAANISAKQVQIAWIKLANKGPKGNLAEHGKKLQRDTLAVLQLAKTRFPNLRIVYLGSRIYGGYATTPLNPEPFAYESAFAARWLMQDQMKGDSALNFDARRGDVKAPLLLWGPYLWANAVKGRKFDGLIWSNAGFAQDGTHPAMSGREKVAKLLLEFFKNDSLAKTWFAKR